MSIRNHLVQVQLVKAGPSLRERLAHRITVDDESPIVGRLRQFREQLERDMQPEPWTDLQGPMVLLLADVCDAFGLSERERAAVLGELGERTLQELLGSRSVFPPRNPLNDRQTRALDYVRFRGSINLGAYRKLCPDWSDETLRRDLVDLADRGLLTKNGSNKGTYYTAAT